jgi:hypothetical protein
MLVLSRKAGEEIVIDDQIRIQIVRVRGSRVRIGIEAPAEVRIRRSDSPPDPKTPHSKGPTALCSSSGYRP